MQTIADRRKKVLDIFENFKVRGTSIEDDLIVKHRILWTYLTHDPSVPVPTNRCQTQTILKWHKSGMMQGINDAEPAQAECSWAVVFAQKRTTPYDTFKPFKFNYRIQEPNTSNVKDTNLISWIDACFGFLGKAKIYQTLQASFGYFQIEFDYIVENKTGIKSIPSNIEFIEVAWSQRRSKNVPKNNRQYLVYQCNEACNPLLGNHDPFLSFFADHLSRILTILRLLSRTAVSQKLEICVSLEEFLKYLDHVMQNLRLSISTKRT